MIEKIVTAWFVIVGVVMLAAIALAGVAVYVAYHFISKVW